MKLNHIYADKRAEALATSAKARMLCGKRRHPKPLRPEISTCTACTAVLIYMFNEGDRR